VIYFKKEFLFQMTHRKLWFSSLPSASQVETFSSADSRSHRMVKTACYRTSDNTCSEIDPQRKVL